MAKRESDSRGTRRSSDPDERHQAVPWITRTGIPDSGNFYTQPGFCVYIHGIEVDKSENQPIFPVDDPETLDYLASFDHIRNSNYYRLPDSWVEYLHTYGGKRRKLVFYQMFQTIRFPEGKENPRPVDEWKVRFLDDHLHDHFTINPLIPPENKEFSPGRWGRYPHVPFTCYYFNYGNGRMDDYLIHRYIDVKLADWGYDGLYFDLMGSFYTNDGEIRSPTDPGKGLNPIDVYNSLAHTRDDPNKTYDENGAAFLMKLRERSPDPAGFPIWSNMVYRSGDMESGANEYYRVVGLDQIEELSATLFNSEGCRAGVRVNLDGVWYEDANPVETRIIPFFEGVKEVEPLLRQCRYAAEHYGNPAQGIALDFVRPYYEPFEDGYRARVDREALYYSHLCALVIGVHAYAWDYYDTYLPRTRVEGIPNMTGLPRQGHFKWVKDPIHFLDLGDRMDDEYEVQDLGEGKTAVLRFFTKGFIVVNASEPAQDIEVEMAGTPLFRGGGRDVSGTYDHFTQQALPADVTKYKVPAAYYTLSGKLTNSARVFSYLSEDGKLID